MFVLVSNLLHEAFSGCVVCIDESFVILVPTEDL